MTWEAGRRYPPESRASPGGHPPSFRHSASSSGPAARWMAPSTPPPPSSERFAALTIASSSSVVMSATQTSRCAAPISAENSGFTSGMAAMLSRPFGLRFRPQVDGAFHADIGEMLVEKAPRRPFAVGAQHFEEIIVGRQFRGCVEVCAEAVEQNAMHVDAPVLAGPNAARQTALIDQARDEFDGAVFRDQRRIEGDFIEAVHDLAGGGWRLLPHQRIDLHDHHVFGLGGAKERKDHRVAQVAAVPIGHA